ncbi:MAG: 1-(5-phosphoribosyl)-5-[Firmicutes bacterium]|nr:1-(5-phosphoribosyl)-5-[(5-phosphoribosylamino)methylideneamino]imidazole-4-carboxamide isomerase [Bacillota bacterium]
MKLFPAIDLYEGKAVRLFKGDYAQMTVYSSDPVSVAMDFKAKGAECIHLVDLEGARDGSTPNFETVCAVKNASGLFCEIGGGIRGMDTVRRYLGAGIDRVILGTAAVSDPEFLDAAVAAYGDRIAVGVDIKDGLVAIKGWTESSGLEAFAFCRQLQQKGVSCLICTDISRDGAMRGTNRELYARLQKELSLNITASGGVSTLGDVMALARLGMYGAIIGKAYYTGAIDLAEAVRCSQNE